MAKSYSNNNYENEDFIVKLKIEGSEYQESEIKISNLDQTISSLINDIVSLFELPYTDKKGYTINYFLVKNMHENLAPKIIELFDSDGRELNLTDHDIVSGDTLHLINMHIMSPLKNGSDYYEEEDYIIKLTIEGTEYEDVEVKVTDPNRTLRDQIERIVSVFELPHIDNGGNCIQYLLGQKINEDDEPEILEFEDENGREQALVDYNIQPGDSLHLISVPIAGYACPIPLKMEEEWNNILTKKYIEQQDCEDKNENC